MAALSLYLFSAALPLYLSRSLGYSTQLVGIVVAVASIVQMVATLAVGPLVDRRGARLAMRFGAACYLAAAGLFLVSGWFPIILVARVLQGLGISLVLPAVFSVVPQVVSRGFQGTAIGLVGAFNNVALAAGPPLGLLFLARGPGLLFGAALVAAAAALLVSLPLRVGAGAPEAGRLLKYRGAWTPLYAITFLCVVYWGVVTAFLPIEVPARQVPNVGWFFAADAVAVMASRIPAGYLADRFGPRWLLVGGGLVTALGVVLVMAPPSFTTLLLAGIATGTGAALLLPPILLELTRRSDSSDRGTAMALYQTAFAAAVAAGSLGGAVLVQRFGFGLALVTSLCSCLATIPIALLTVRRIEDH
jgi:MFS family permease